MSDSTRGRRGTKFGALLSAGGLAAGVVGSVAAAPPAQAANGLVSVEYFAEQGSLLPSGLDLAFFSGNQCSEVTAPEAGNYLRYQNLTDETVYLIGGPDCHGQVVTSVGPGQSSSLVSTPANVSFKAY